MKTFLPDAFKIQESILKNRPGTTSIQALQTTREILRLSDTGRTIEAYQKLVESTSRTPSASPPKSAESGVMNRRGAVSFHK